MKMSASDSGLSTPKSIGSEQWDTLDNNNSLLPKLPKVINKNINYGSHNSSRLDDDTTEELTKDDPTLKYQFADTG